MVDSVGKPTGMGTVHSSLPACKRMLALFPRTVHTCSLHPEQQESGHLLGLAQPCRRGLRAFLRHLEDFTVHEEEGRLVSWPGCSLKGVTLKPLLEDFPVA